MKTDVSISTDSVDLLNINLPWSSLDSELSTCARRFLVSAAVGAGGLADGTGSSKYGTDLEDEAAVVPVPD